LGGPQRHTDAPADEHRFGDPDAEHDRLTHVNGGPQPNVDSDADFYSYGDPDAVGHADAFDIAHHDAQPHTVAHGGSLTDTLGHEARGTAYLLPIERYLY